MSETKEFRVVTGGTYPIDQIVTAVAHMVHDSLREGPMGMVIQIEVARRAGLEPGTGLNSPEETAAWKKHFTELVLAALGMTAAVVVAESTQEFDEDDETHLNVGNLTEVGLDVMIEGTDGACDEHDHDVRKPSKAKVRITQHGDVTRGTTPEASTGYGQYL